MQDRGVTVAAIGRHFGVDDHTAGPVEAFVDPAVFFAPLFARFREACVHVREACIHVGSQVGDPGVRRARSCCDSQHDPDPDADHGQSVVGSHGRSLLFLAVGFPLGHRRGGCPSCANRSKPFGLTTCPEILDLTHLEAFGQLLVDFGVGRDGAADVDRLSCRDCCAAAQRRDARHLGLCADGAVVSDDGLVRWWSSLPLWVRSPIFAPCSSSEYFSISAPSSIVQPFSV